MARKPSALKAARASLRRRILNYKRRTTIERLARAIKISLKPNDKLLQEFQKAVDKAAGRGVIHPRTAARLKSRLVHHIKNKNQKLSS